MIETLEFGKPPAWAYPTVGGLQAIGTPLPEQIRVLVHGRADQRIDIDETLLLDEDETKKQIVEAAISQAGSYDVDDFVESFVTIAHGRAHVVGYILMEERISEYLDAWNDETDEEILESFVVNTGLDIDIRCFDLYVQRL